MKKMIKVGLPLMTAFATLSSVLLAPNPVFCADAPDKEPLSLALPQPTLKGTPEEKKDDPNIEPIPKKMALVMVPKGVKNVALNKPGTSSVTPFTGRLSQSTVGK